MHCTLHFSNKNAQFLTIAFTIKLLVTVYQIDAKLTQKFSVKSTAKTCQAAEPKFLLPSFFKMPYLTYLAF